MENKKLIDELIETFGLQARFNMDSYLMYLYVGTEIQGGLLETDGVAAIKEAIEKIRSQLMKKLDEDIQRVESIGQKYKEEQK